MSDGFVVFRSMVESIDMLPEERRWEFFKELFEYRMTGADPQPQTDLERMALVNISPVIDSVAERFKASQINGAKGGRPTKRRFIPPEEWKEYLSTHTNEETAAHFGITDRTLRNWIKAEKTQPEKTGKNPYIDIDMDTDIDTDKDIYINKTISISKNKKNNKSGEVTEAAKAAPSPRLRNEEPAGRMRPGFEFEIRGQRYRINESGEAVMIGSE